MNRIDIQQLIDANDTLLAECISGKNTKKLYASPGISAFQIIYCLGGRTIFKAFTEKEKAESFYNDLEF